MRTLLIDGNNLLYRTFWAANYKAKNNSPGSTAATYIFLRALKSYADKFAPWDKIYCVWDKRLAYPLGNFRSELCATEYKGGRDDERFKNVFDNLDDIIQILDTLGVHNFYPHRMEADDAISWLSETIDGEKIIITTDKDMLQLINDEIEIYNTNTKKIINKDNFKEHTDIDTPKDYFFFRCFTGDKSDNIPGIPKVGLKTYLKMTKNWNYNLDNVDLTESQKGIVTTNIFLMDLKYGYGYYEEETVTYRAQYYQTKDKRNVRFDNFLERCKSLGFESINKKPSDWSQTFVPKKNSLLNCVNNIKERYNNVEST